MTGHNYKIRYIAALYFAKYYSNPLENWPDYTLCLDLFKELSII
jgi:hypothetical protein